MSNYIPYIYIHMQLFIHVVNLMVVEFILSLKDTQTAEFLYDLSIS